MLQQTQAILLFAVLVVKGNVPYGSCFLSFQLWVKHTRRESSGLLHNPYMVPGFAVTGCITLLLRTIVNLMPLA